MLSTRSLIRNQVEPKRLLDREPVRRITDRQFLADGLTTLRYLSQRVGFEYEPRDDGLLTIAALMHDQLERFPSVGDRCLWEGFQFIVTKAGGPGESIQVEVIKSAKPAESENPQRQLWIVMETMLLLTL